MQTLPQPVPLHAKSCSNSRTPAPAYAGMPPAGKRRAEKKTPLRRPGSAVCGDLLKVLRTEWVTAASLNREGIARWNTAGKWLADWHQLGIVECKLVPIHGTNSDPVVKAYALSRLFGGTAEGIA